MGLLEDDVLDVGQRRTDTLQQQVEGLHGNHLSLALLLVPILTSRTQREAQMELRKPNTPPSKLGRDCIRHACLSWSRRKGWIFLQSMKCYAISSNQKCCLSNKCNEDSCIIWTPVDLVSHKPKLICTPLLCIIKIYILVCTLHKLTRIYSIIAMFSYIFNELSQHTVSPYVIKSIINDVVVWCSLMIALNTQQLANNYRYMLLIFQSLYQSFTH